MAEKKKLYAASATDLLSWDQANPGTVVPLETVIVIRPEHITCDECGKAADTIHFRGAEDGPPKGNSIVVKFACADHDFGLYYVDIASFIDPQRAESFASHIAHKNWGLHGLAALRDRLSQIEREQQIEAGVYS